MKSVLDLKEQKMNSSTYRVEGAFIIPKETIAQLNYSQDIIKFIKKSAMNKRKFLEQNPKLDADSVFTNILLNYEIEANKDIIFCSYEEIYNIFKKLLELKVITTKPLYRKYSSIVEAYITWGYNNDMRYDIVSTKDIIENAPFEELVDTEEVAKRVVTLKEMQHYIDMLESDFAKLACMCVLEGLESTEIVELKKSDFKQEKNHDIQLPSRTISLSDELYLKLREFSKTDTEYKKSMRNKIVVNTNYRYAETDYVFRPQHRHYIKNEPMKFRSLLNVVRKELNDVGFEGSLKDFKYNMMMIDIYNKVDIEIIGKKYNKIVSNYTHDSLISSKKVEYNILLEKITQEKEEELRKFKENLYQ